jgi:hypothetical protein
MNSPRFIIYPLRWYWRGRTPSGLPRLFGNHRVGFLHAAKGGAPVLRGEASWRTVSGVYGNVFGGFFTLQWRRHF